MDEMKPRVCIGHSVPVFVDAPSARRNVLSSKSEWHSIYNIKLNENQ